MAFEKAGFAVAFIALASASGCSGPDARFPLRDAITLDGDLTPVSLPCRPDPTPKDPKHIACAPELYVSPLAWDGIDNSIFRPLSDTMAARPSTEAVNANAMDEVAESAWFTNRIGVLPMSAQELERGACEAKQMLRDTENTPDGAWVIDKGKDNGSSPGFRVKIPGKGKYMLKSDGGFPERPSAASAIGGAAYYATGFNFSCEQVIYIKRSAFTLTPGLTVTDNTERVHPFDQAALNKVLDGASKRGEYLRFQASAWLEGRLIGPFRYEGTRHDDPNDVIPHEDRRELRGARLIAAWLQHIDAREQNSMDVWVANDPKNPDSSPGYVRHYYLDTSDILGSSWDWDLITKRLGFSYLLDWGDISFDFATLGFVSRPWDRAQIEPGQEIFNYYSTRDFDPEGWLNEYPNPAFSRMTERDGAWMARILARFTPDLVHQLALIGKFSKQENTDYVERTMEGRLEKVLERYLTHLSSITQVHVEGDSLCGVDLAELRLLRPANEFHYRARVRGELEVPTVRPGYGSVCVPMPHVAQDGGAPPDAPERYTTVRIHDGVAKGPLVAHLYDLGPRGGYRLVGIERPEP